MKMNTIGEEILKEWQREDAEASQMMSLYQQVANHFYPSNNAIMSTRTAGEDKSLPIIDPTGIRAAEKMTAGMSSVILPAGQYFCRLIADDNKLNNNESVRSYLAYATEVLHEQIYKSNFPEQFNDFLMSLTVFGTANIYSEFDIQDWKLRFENWSVANFRFSVDKHGKPNKCLIKWKYTAEQAVEMFGGTVSDKILREAIEPKTRDNKYTFIICVRQKKDRNGNILSNQQYPYEKIIIEEQSKQEVFENGRPFRTGYEQFPFTIVRWVRGNDNEKWGYGQGTVALSSSKELQIQRRSLILAAELANTPPMQTHTSFEGTPKVYPRANNRVMEMDTIKALDTRLHGNFPITRETIELTKEDINEAFYIKTFAPLDNLPGDRRTTVEIIERVKSGYMQLVRPVTRLYNEGLTPLVERCVLQLLKYRILEPPPPELRGFKVSYLGRLALALQEQQADALQRFGQFAMAMEQVIPNFTIDNLNIDRAGRRMATTFGVAEGDLNTDEERAAIRQERAQREQQQMMLMAAQTAGKAYKDTSAAAEEGSPANALIAAAGE